MYEVYNIETLASEAEGGGVVRRIQVRTDSLDAIKERARRILSRARLPQARGPQVEAVRVVNGAGYEVFHVSARD